jgi:hypothetical protein
MEDGLVKSIEAASRDTQKIRLELEAQTEPKSMIEIERKIVDLDRMEREWKRSSAQKASLEEILKGLRAAVVEEKRLDPGAPDLTDLDARIQIGEEKLSALDQFIPAMGGFERRKKEAAILEVEIVALEAAIEACGPKGLRLQVTSDAALGDFQGTISSSMEKMGFTIDLKPLLHLTDDPHVNGRPARFLSASESVRFSMAFAIAVARWAKLGIVCVDAWDSLDEESVLSAGAVLSGASDLQRFVFTTPRKGMKSYEDTAATINSGESGVCFYVLKEGPEGEHLVIRPSRSR